MNQISLPEVIHERYEARVELHTARVLDLEAERDTYRELLQLAIHHLHDSTRTLQQQRRTIAELREMLRRLHCDERRAA